MHDIHLATTDADIASTFAVMHQLRTKLVESEYVALVRKQQQTAGYLLAYVREADRVVAAAGFKVSCSLAWGDFVYIDDLVTDANTRSQGHGTELMKWIADYGRQRGCKELHLDSGVQRFAAHRFYLRERMDITCHHFAMSIASPS
jgi:GNAT superfamily N-acetyltransferase